MDQLLTVIFASGFAATLLKLLVDWGRGRRKERAEDEIAEGSVRPSLVERNLSVADQQIVLLEKAHAAERASYDRRIKALEDDVHRLTDERDELRSNVDQARSRIENMQTQLDALRRQLESLQTGRP